MAHRPFNVGDVVTNNEMWEAYRIGNMGGMRKSNTYNCLVLISDHTKRLYEDKWYGDELHYTGMGKVGDRSWMAIRTGPFTVLGSMESKCISLRSSIQESIHIAVS